MMDLPQRTHACIPLRCLEEVQAMGAVCSCLSAADNSSWPPAAIQQPAVLQSAALQPQTVPWCMAQPTTH